MMVVIEIQTQTAAVEPVGTRPGSKVFQGVKTGVGLLGTLLQTLLGLIFLVLLLSILAAIPILNLYSLGVLLAAQGEVARSGKWCAGFPLLAPARQAGLHLLGMGLFLLPLVYLGNVTAEAFIIAPNATATQNLGRVTQIATWLVSVHLLLSLARGAGLSGYLRPIKNGVWFVQQLRQRELVSGLLNRWEPFVQELNVRRHVWLGFQGALGVLLWTFLPTVIYAAASSTRPAGILLTLLGGTLLTLVLCWAPLLQTEFARKEQFSVFLQLRSARERFARAPALWTLVIALGFAASLVLYLFKIVAPPRDAVWLLTPFFIVLIYPMRLLLARVDHWAGSREQPAWWGWRWLWSFVQLVLCGFYVFLLFFTRNIGANGKLVLFEQPFLLIPSPF